MERDGVTHKVRDLNWLYTIRRYLTWSAVLHLVWEVLQLPLYTLWQTGTAREIAFAVVHCTAGDVMIAIIALVAALVLVGGPDWPRGHHLRVTLALLIVGIVYTIYSEWLNTVVRQSWAYAPFMPRVPGLGTGLAPLLQWIVVPLLALWISCNRSDRVTVS